jgi:hypothetical protein
VKHFHFRSRLPLFEEFLNEFTPEIDSELNLFQYYGREVSIGRDEDNPPSGLRLDFIGPEQIKGGSDTGELQEVPLPNGKYLIRGNDNEYVQLVDFEDLDEDEIRKCYLIRTQQFEEIKSKFLTGYTYR